MKFPLVDLIFLLLGHYWTRHGATARTADRAVLIELTEFRAVICASSTPPFGQAPVLDDARCPRWPLLAQTIPADLSLVSPPVSDCPDGRGGIAAIELLDGAPRGVGQSDRERERILRIADSLDIAVVAASNFARVGSHRERVESTQYTWLQSDDPGACRRTHRGDDPRPRA